MFDAKQILDALVKAQAMGQPQPGQAPAPASGSSGSLGDILGQLTGGQGGGGLGGLLGQLAGGGQPGGGQGGQAGGGGLGGLLGQIFGGGLAPAGGTAPEPASGGGGWADTIASEVGKVAGPRAGGLVQQAIAFAKTPQGAAMLAGLASLLATKTGRQIGSSAATLGGAALVGGLTYKAMQNWQSGTSPQVTSVAPPQEAPAGSGLEPQATSNATATALVGAMIAAAAAELGDPITAATTAQIACTEQVHLALIRQIGGKLPNNVSLAQALFYTPSEALPVLQPFIEGADGFTGPLTFPGDDAIFDFVGQSGVTPVETFAEPSS